MSSHGNGRPDPPMPDGVSDQQVKLAWEHFKFHAEQRTRMFHFFLITIGLLLNAFFVAWRDAAEGTSVLTILLVAGGVFSTLFFALDVRNTQLLEYGEALLRRIEENLYPSSEWHEETDGGTIRLGMLSREALLKGYRKRAAPGRSKTVLRWIATENIKHKLSIRLIVGLSIVLFWIAALTMAHGRAFLVKTPPPGVDAPEEEVAGASQDVAEEAPGEETPQGGRQVPPWFVYVLCSWSVAWTVYAMARPGLDRRWEWAAWRDQVESGRDAERPPERVA